jgi:hypothetical protein
MPGAGSLRSTSSGKGNVDTRTLPRIGGLHRDAEIWKFRMNDWFRREGVVTIENKFSYIITAAEDDIIPSLREEQVRLNRVPTLDECVVLIKKKYWRENNKIDKLRQLKRIIIEPNSI